MGGQIRVSTLERIARGSGGKVGRSDRPRAPFLSRGEDRFDPRRDFILNQQLAVVKLTYLVLL